eukprot:g71100.t1
MFRRSSARAQRALKRAGLTLFLYVFMSWFAREMSTNYILLCFLESLSITYTNRFMRCFIWGLCIGVLMKPSTDPVQRMLANYQNSRLDRVLASYRSSSSSHASTPLPAMQGSVSSASITSTPGFEPRSRPSVYTFASHVRPMLALLAARQAERQNSDSKTLASDVLEVEDDVDCLPVYVTHDAPLQRKVREKKTTRTYNYKKRQKGIIFLKKSDQEGFCYMLVNTELCIQARINNVTKSLKELTSWVASQIEAFDTPQGRVYRVRGSKVCRKMWMRYGIGERTRSRAFSL